MAEHRFPTILNEAQARHLVAVMSHVDELLRHVEALCDGTSSPFAREYQDLDPDEGRLLRSFTAAARRHMVEACDLLGVQRPEPRISARWSAQTALTFASISFAELSPSTMRGYGALPPDAVEAVGALADALEAIADRGAALLLEADGALARSAASLPGPAGEVLRRLERLSAERGLHEVRPLVAAAIDRASATTLDIGVFGRVSAGKSSLVDALLGGPVLPVGAIPITAVPVLVEAGEPSMAVRFLDGRTAEASARELPEFVTEARNPDNTKGVRAVTLRSPSVPPGVRFLDTPGVGSLFSSGPALARASLPRCDLGLVLVAAGTPFGAEDAALATALTRAGIPAALLLSKADTVSDADREASLDYLRQQLQRSVGSAHGMAVIPVSVVAHPEWLDRLRIDVLASAAAEHARGSQRALARRLDRLVALTADALAGREGTLDADMSAEAVRRSVTAEVWARTSALAGAASEVAARVVDAVAEAWHGRSDPRRAAIETILLEAGRASTDVAEMLACAREALSADVSVRPPPVLAQEAVGDLPDLSPPVLVWAPRATARRRLHGVEESLACMFNGFASRLGTWADGLLVELVQQRERTPMGMPIPPELSRAQELVQQLADAEPRPDDLDGSQVERVLVKEGA